MSLLVKSKEPSVVRTYDQDGFRKRAACVCVNQEESKVLLVTSRKDPSLWIVPGGGIEPDEAAACAAVREVQEEAGVIGNLGRCLGVFENANRMHRTSVFVLVVTDELEDWDESRTFGRQRRWFTVEAAVSALHKPLQSNYVKLLLPPNHPYHTCPPHPHIEPIRSSPELHDSSLASSTTTSTAAAPPPAAECCIEGSIPLQQSSYGTTEETHSAATMPYTSNNTSSNNASSVTPDCKEHCQLSSAAPNSLTASISTG